jgi:hypothetical protein
MQCETIRDKIKIVPQFKIVHFRADNSMPCAFPGVAPVWPPWPPGAAACLRRCRPEAGGAARGGVTAARLHCIVFIALCCATVLCYWGVLCFSRGKVTHTPAVEAAPRQ